MAIAVVEVDGVDVGILLEIAAATEASTPRWFLTSTRRLTGNPPLDLVGPLHVNPLLRMLAELGDILAILGVHHDAAAGRKEAENRVARNRPAPQRA